MQRVIGEMLFRVLPRVDLATLIGNAEGMGYAIRYGFIEPRREALDGIDDFTALAERGYAADQADTDRQRDIHFNSTSSGELPLYRSTYRLTFSEAPGRR